MTRKSWREFTRWPTPPDQTTKPYTAGIRAGLESAMSNNDRSRILKAVISNLKSFRHDIDLDKYDEQVRTYFPSAAREEMMRVRTLGSEAIEEAARRLY